MTFEVGACFDPRNPIARFITGLAMISNDWLRLYGQMTGVESHYVDAEGLRLLSFRQQAGLYFEAAGFIAKARRRFPTIKAFIDGLDGEARAACERVVGGVDPKSEHYVGDWLETLRNSTFHYDELHPSKASNDAERIAEGLKLASDKTGTIEEDERIPGGIRFGFADEVVVQWLPDLDEPVWLEQLREAVLALGSFVREAAFEYIQSLDIESYTITP